MRGEEGVTARSSWPRGRRDGLGVTGSSDLHGAGDTQLCTFVPCHGAASVKQEPSVLGVVRQ